MVRLTFVRLGLLFFAHSAVWADAVLVVPFFNESKSGSVDWIGESFSETIRESLASQGLLLFTRENRVEAYRRLSIRPNAPLTRASIIKLGEALDATQVIWGHYELVAPRPQAGTTAAPAVSPRDSLRVVARVLDLKHTRQGPEFEETGALEDLASLETRMAWRCLKFLAPRNAPSEEDFRRDRPALRLDAIETGAPPDTAVAELLTATAADAAYRIDRLRAALSARAPKGPSRQKRRAPPRRS